MRKSPWSVIRFAFALMILFSSKEVFGYDFTVSTPTVAPITLNNGQSLLVTNTGRITTAGASTVTFAGINADLVDNFGILTTTDASNTLAAQAGLNANVTINNYNAAEINANNGNAANTAITFAGSAGGTAATVSNAGTIRGIVDLSGSTGSNYYISGNAIHNGNFIGAGGGVNSGLVSNATNYTTSGTYSGINTMTVQSGVFAINNPLTATTCTIDPAATVNLTGGAGTITTTMTNNGTFNASGTGAFTGSMTSTSPTSILNVNGGTFSPTGAITNVGTINVAAGGTFSPTTAPTGFSTFNNAGTSTFINVLAIPAAATFTNTGTLNMNHNNITAGAGATVNIGTFATQGSTITANGGAYTLNVQAGKTFTIENAVTGFSSFTIAGTASLVGAGLNIAGATLTNNGTLNTNTQTITGAAGSVFVSNSNFLNDGPITNVETINVTGGTYTMNVAPTGFTTYAIANGGTTVLNVNFPLGAGATLTNNGTLTMNAHSITGQAGSVLNSGSAAFTVDGLINNVPTINITAGTTNINVAPTGFTLFTIANGATVAANVPLSINGATLTDSGALNMGANQLSGNAGSILNLSSNANPGFTSTGLVTGIGTINETGSGVFNFANVAQFTTFSVTNAASTTNISGTLTGNAATLTTNGTFTTTGLVSGNTTINVNGGTTSFNGGANGFTNFTIANGATTNVGGTLNLTAATVTNNGTLNTNLITGAGASTLTTTGTLTSTGLVTGVNTVNANGGTSNFNGGMSAFTTFTIANGATANFGANLDMSNATVNDNGTLAMGANQILGNNTSILNLNSNFTATGLITNVGTINSTAGTVTFTNVPTGFVDFNMNGANVVLGANLVLSPNATATFNGGTLTTNGNSITAAPATNTTFTVNSNFTTSDPITDISTINALGGVFTIDTAPTGFSTLHTGAAGTIVLNTNLGIPANAAITNAGTFNLNGNTLSMGTNSSLTTTGLVLASGPIISGGVGYTVAVNNGGSLIVTNAVSGYTNLAVALGGSLSLNSGANVSDSIVLNGGTLNLNSGVYNGNVTGANGIVNVNSSFTPPGTITAGTININSGGSLNGSNGIVATTWNINNGGILFSNNNILGSVALNSGGTFVPTQLGVTNITGNYVQGGTLDVSLLNSTQYTQLQVVGNTTLNGGVIQVTLPDNGTSISDKEVFNIISSGSLTNNALPAVSSPSSVVLSFTPVVNGNILELIANRKTISSVNNNPTFNGVSGALDQAQSAGNTGLAGILAALERQGSLAGFEQILSQLVPEEALTPLLEPWDAQRLSLEEVFKRMNLLRVGEGNFKTDYVAGDMSDNKNSYGPYIFGNATKQKQNAGISGHTSTMGGFGFLADTPVWEDTHVGVAISYAGTSVRRDDMTGNNTMINTVQGILYGSTEYGPLFADGALTYGVNKYHGKRNILVLNQTALSNYTGVQYGAKVRGGFSVTLGSAELSPIGSIHFIHLNRGSYVETGAPGANLSVKPRQLSDVQVGLGGRLMDVSQAEEFLPEIHVLYIVDVRRANLMVTSQFVNGGPAFVTAGPLPPKAGINVGGSITAMLTDQLLLTAAYDLDAKKTINSNSASIKFRWLF